MELHEQINTINTKEDLAQFIQNLRLDLMTNIGDWENPNLEQFLDAMSAWVGSMDNVYKNMGENISVQPDWNMFANIAFLTQDDIAIKWIF